MLPVFKLLPQGPVSPDPRRGREALPARLADLFVSGTPRLISLLVPELSKVIAA